MEETDLIFEFSELYKTSRKNNSPGKSKARFRLIRAKGDVYYVQRIGTKTVYPYHKDYLKPVDVN